MLGLVAAALAGRVLESLLFGVAPLDPLTFVVGSTVFLSAAVAVCVLLAGRAARVDPAVALRTCPMRFRGEVCSWPSDDIEDEPRGMM